MHLISFDQHINREDDMKYQLILGSVHPIAIPLCAMASQQESMTYKIHTLHSDPHTYSEIVELPYYCSSKPYCMDVYGCEILWQTYTG
jgi:hypothetical protein